MNPQVWPVLHIYHVVVKLKMDKHKTCRDMWGWGRTGSLNRRVPGITQTYDWHETREPDHGELQLLPLFFFLNKSPENIKRHYCHAHHKTDWWWFQTLKPVLKNSKLQEKLHFKILGGKTHDVELEKLLLTQHVKMLFDGTLFYRHTYTGVVDKKLST